MKWLLTIILLLGVAALYAQTKKAANTVPTGTSSFTYNNQQYDAIVVDPKRQEIKMHWRNSDGVPYKNLEAVKHTLHAEKQQVLMLTNAGMYMEHNVPLGLYIENGKVLRPLNVANNEYGNFYMQPNGVFYIDKWGPHVLARQWYEKLVRQRKTQPIYATQSGPMLVVNGKINALFNPQSKNLNLRSGVGQLRDGRIVFIISRAASTSFYDFASIFKDKFGCVNALFLDGAISRVYLPTVRPNDLGGDFGAVISVVERR